MSRYGVMPALVSMASPRKVGLKALIQLANGSYISIAYITLAWYKQKRIAQSCRIAPLRSCPGKMNLYAKSGHLIFR
ncbi:transmembrane protein, putative [Medicago truncatula]|uniref:Transmembrane protein, putative n=1 Tax=Medicago truncatula TaxID=3880 RepID=G7JHS1_MEDTR|nr:transmembrane protein, putative [Medicago truncatula]